LNNLLSFIIGIVFGMIPFSYILGKLKGIDLRKVGSGNIGATNLGRQAGLPFFIFGFVLDGLKGLIPVLIANNLGYITAFAGAGAILGHIFNPIFKFRGGKGVATMIGVGIGIVPRSFLISLAAWIVIYLMTYIVALASIGFAIALPLMSFIIKEATFTDRIFLMIMAGLIIFAHRSNIGRIIRKKEPKYILWRKK
jgi:glycerol-3-phosphate acyltransferase PlsY